MPSVIAPSSDNFILGSAMVYLDKIVGGFRTGEAALGQITKAAYSLTDETKEVYSSMSGTRELLKRAPVKRTAQLKLTGQEFSMLNHTLLSAGVIQKVTQPAGTTTAEQLSASGTTLGGCYYATKFRNISMVTLHAAGVPLTAGVDYSLDLTTNSRIYIIPGGAADGIEGVTIDYSYASLTFNQVAAGANSGLIEAAIRIVPDNTTGPQQEYEFWHGQISMDGDVGIISDDFGNWSISVFILAERQAHPEAPWYVVRDL